MRETLYIATPLARALVPVEGLTGTWDCEALLDEVEELTGAGGELLALQAELLTALVLDCDAQEGQMFWELFRGKTDAAGLRWPATEGTALDIKRGLRELRRVGLVRVQ